MSMNYDLIVTATRENIVRETRNKLSARRSFLEGLVADAEREMARLDNERLGHFLARHVAAAELADLDATERRFNESR